MTRARDGRSATLEVASMRMHQGRPVILFKGIGSMDDAERLAGTELRIAGDAGDAELLEEGEFFHRDLIGCAVVTETAIRSARSPRSKATAATRGWS